MKGYSIKDSVNGLVTFIFAVLVYLQYNLKIVTYTPVTYESLVISWLDYLHTYRVIRAIIGA